MVPVILDTDMAYDVDDVGALACLHALADRREAKILGVVYNETHPLGPIAIDVINRWYGRQVPIGAFKGILARRTYSAGSEAFSALRLRFGSS